MDLLIRKITLLIMRMNLVNNETEIDNNIDDNLYKMYLSNTVKELRAIAKAKKVLTKGTKQELITRIINSNI